MKQAGEVASKLLARPKIEKQNDSALVTTKTSQQLRSNTQGDNVEVMSRRRVRISQLLDRQFLDKGQTPPPNDLLAAMVHSWDEHLTRNRVPADRLDDVYNRAVDDYTDQGPFSVFDMLKAWKAICAEESASRPRQVVCEWEHVDEDMNVIVVWIATGLDVTMPCPDCRPAAFEQKRLAMLEQGAAVNTKMGKESKP